jgi:hypothetical protein
MKGRISEFELRPRLVFDHAAGRPSSQQKSVRFPARFFQPIKVSR